MEVVFDDYAAASDFLDELRQAEPEAMFFELHPPGTSNRVESFRLPRRAEGTTYTDVLAREYSSLSENQAALLAAMVEAQHLPTAALRRRQVIERVWPDRKRTGRPRDIRNSLQNLENQVRGRVGPMPVLFAAALAEERAKHENLDAQVETNPRQAARQGGRVYDAPRPGVNQDEPRNAAVEQACFMHVNGRPEDTLLLRDGVKVFGIVHWPTFTNREGLEPLDE